LILGTIVINGQAPVLDEGLQRGPLVSAIM